MCPDVDRIWSPRGGEPIIAELYENCAERVGK